MAFVTKTWKDRLVEYAGRRKLKNVATGEEILMDVSRSEGTVNQAGDAFSAANMNNLEQRIKTEFDSVNSSLQDQPIFEYDSTGKITGYKTKVGADTVFPFNNRIKLTGAKYNIYITSSDNARNVTVDVLKDGYVQLCCVPITGGSSLIYSDYYACLYVNQVIQENILTDSNMCCSDIAEVKSGDVLKLFLPAFFTSKGQTKGYLIYTEGVI